MAWTEVTFTPHTNAICIGLSLSLLYSNLLPYRIGWKFNNTNEQNLKDIVLSILVWTRDRTDVLAAFCVSQCESPGIPRSMGSGPLLSTSSCFLVLLRYPLYVYVTLDFCASFTLPADQDIILLEEAWVQCKRSADETESTSSALTDDMGYWHTSVTCRSCSIRLLLIALINSLLLGSPPNFKLCNRFSA